jgi:hypothetical protein
MSDKRTDDEARDGSKAAYTTKQMGDACEMLVAAELTLAKVPALKAPDYWPGYDVIAQPPNAAQQRISVKSRTFKRGAAFVRSSAVDVFDWLAVVILPGEDFVGRRIFVIPRSAADKNARRYSTERMTNVWEYRIDEVARKFAAYENNFSLKLDLTIKPIMRLTVTMVRPCFRRQNRPTIGRRLGSERRSPTAAMGGKRP